MFSCSNTQKVMIECGHSLEKYGVKPFHKANTPSFLTTLTSTSIEPLYSGLPSITFMFWIRVFAISTGIEATVVTKPLERVQRKKRLANGEHR